MLIQIENRIILEKTQDREERIRKEVKHLLKSSSSSERGESKDKAKDSKPRHYIG